VRNISARAKRVWQRLVEWYGTRLIEQYGESPPEDWCEAVDTVDNEAVKRGLASIRSKYIAHPPTFPQFSEAFAPPRSFGSQTKNTCELLTAFVMRTHGDRLTPRQIRGPWMYIGRTFDAEDGAKKVTKDHGYEITGVIIDQDGDSDGLRVMVADMQLENLEFPRRQSLASPTTAR
jgi:hypothetical protein